MMKKKILFIIIPIVVIVYVVMVIHTNHNFHLSRTDYPMNQEVEMEGYTVTCVDANLYPFSAYLTCLSDEAKKTDSVVDQVKKGLLETPYVLEYRLRIANHTEEEMSAGGIGLNCYTNSWYNGVHMEYVIDRNEELSIAPGKTKTITQVVLCFPEHFQKKEWKKLTQGADTFYVNLETGLDKVYIKLNHVPVQLEMIEEGNTQEETVVSEKMNMDEPESEEDIAKNYDPISDWLEHPERPGLKLRILDAFVCNSLEQHKEIRAEHFQETRIGSIIDDDIIFSAGEYPDTLTSGKHYYEKFLSDRIDEVLPEYTKLDSFLSEDEELTLKKKKELDLLLEENKEVIEQCMVYQPVFWVFQTVEIVNESKENYCFAEILPKYALEDNNGFRQVGVATPDYIDDSRCSKELYNSGFQFLPGERFVYTLGTMAYWGDSEKHSLKACYVGWGPDGYSLDADADMQEFYDITSPEYNVVSIPVDREVLNEFNN